MTDKIERVLDVLWQKGLIGEQQEKKKDISQATQAIKQIILECVPEGVLNLIQQRIDYITKYQLNSDYTNGFSGIESGECCDKCKMPEDTVNPLRVLVGCKDPFQINCKCHIPYRKVAVNTKLNLLKEIKDDFRTELLKRLGGE